MSVQMLQWNVQYLSFLSANGMCIIFVYIKIIQNQGRSMCTSVCTCTWPCVLYHHPIYPISLFGCNTPVHIAYWEVNCYDNSTVAIYSVGTVCLYRLRIAVDVHDTMYQTHMHHQNLPVLCNFCANHKTYPHVDLPIIQPYDLHVHVLVPS